MTKGRMEGGAAGVRVGNDGMGECGLGTAMRYCPA